ncbi:hypothetical protein [Aquabacterium sp.]|uniref:hypothetical protein n=1 Tax=Aquabacterium sp. TaxID=1872578 RepID=UPI0037836207
MRTLVILFMAALAWPLVATAQTETVPLDDAAFTEYMASRLRNEVGEAAVVVKGPLTLGLGELQAKKNLRSTLKPLMDIAKAAAPGQIGSIVGDTYDPSRLLLHDTWEPLAKQQGGTLIVAIPATDAVFYVGEDTPVAIGALRAMVMNVLSRAPNRLSDVLLRWTPTGWEPVR